MIGPLVRNISSSDILMSHLISIYIHGIPIDIIGFTVISQERHSLNDELGDEMLQKGLKTNPYDAGRIESTILSPDFEAQISQAVRPKKIKVIDNNPERVSRVLIRRSKLGVRS